MFSIVVASLAPAIGGTLLITNPAARQVTFIDTGTGKQRASAPTGEGPSGIAVSPDGSQALVANYGGASLTLLDVGRGQARATISLSPMQRPLSVRWLADGRRVLVTVQGKASLVIVNVASGGIEASIGPAASTDHQAVLSADGKFAFLAAPGGGKIAKFSLADGKQAGQSMAQAQAQAIALAPDGKRLWVVDRGEDLVRVFDSGTLQSIASLDAGNLPMAVALTPNGRYALVSNALSADVAVYDTATLEQANIFPTRSVATDEPAAPDEYGLPDTKRLAQISIPVGIITASDGVSAYVMNNFSGEIIRFDIFTGAALQVYQSNPRPAGIAYSPAGPGGG